LEERPIEGPIVQATIAGRYAIDSEGEINATWLADEDPNKHKREAEARRKVGYFETL
jgi:hypothetical protein